MASTYTPFDPSAEQLAKLRRWRISTFCVMLVGYIGYYIIRGNLAVAMPLMSQEFGYTNRQLGVIMTFSELAYALGKFTTGPLADHWGGKTTFLTGLIGGIFFNLLFPAVPKLFFFTAVWCLVRYFLSMGWGGVIKTIGEWYEPERNGTIMGFISINFQFGGVLASLFGGLLIALGVGWRGLFFWPPLLALAVVVMAAFASKESPQKLFPGVRFGKNNGTKKAIVEFHSDAEGRPNARTLIARLMKLAQFRQVLVFSFFTTVLRSFFMFWIPKFMVDMGMGNAGAAMTSAVFPFVGCLGTVALGWYTDRYAINGDRAAATWKMLIGLVLSLVLIALRIHPNGVASQGPIVVLLGLAGLFLYGPYSMAAGCMTLDIAGAETAGTAAGLVDGFGYIGGAFAAWGAGAIADLWGWAQVFWCLSGLSLVTVVWAFYMSASHHRAKAGQVADEDVAPA